jgi:hypothetical protein
MANLKPRQQKLKAKQKESDMRQECRKRDLTSSEGERKVREK